jgi:hypothetical protein
MLIRSRISRDFFEQEPYSVDWVGPAIWFVAVLAATAVLGYAMVNSGISPFEFDGLG